MCSLRPHQGTSHGLRTNPSASMSITLPMILAEDAKAYENCVHACIALAKWKPYAADQRVRRYHALTGTAAVSSEWGIRSLERLIFESVSMDS